jgi:hypothetical protein
MISAKNEQKDLVALRKQIFSISQYLKVNL